LPDSVDSNKELKDKIGIQKLDGNKTFKANYQVEVI
jgi:hypothetical protein